MSPWSPLHPLQLFLGLVIWSVWFVFLYGGLSLACEFAPPDEQRGALTWVNASMLMLGVLVGSFLFWSARRCWYAAPGADEAAATGRFVARIAAAVYLIAALASVGLVLPSVVLPPCI
ncbi:hypothetical protein [Halopseudomonas pelagia]|uniref:hypothetical protein n=1 Tax=Halopseudomonas pelagia TaxID=553151 RepID=UPI00039A0944|nr:hypothetical protein [Halopseudomonas pelagia]|tara:strand:+ start:41029 stop:41382 length:354 start_codon:yes stop_codon:yes gene_type:complete